MRLQATIQITHKGNWYIARIPELDFISQGRTIDEAKANLCEVVKIQLDEMREMGTLNDYLAECGLTVKGDDIEPEYELIGISKELLQVA